MQVVLDQVGGRVDYILAGGHSGTTKSSTIVDLSGDPRVLRHGDITVADLNAVAPVFAA
jgi:L-threonylcarbamoyladenylate synthase